MNTEPYEKRLLAIERELSARIATETARGGEQTADDSRDAGDASVADEAASLEFSRAAMDSVTLEEVRDALQRIKDGTFGRCVVDDGPIEVQRLDAVPWARYCLKHQTALEGGPGTRPPTL